MNFLEKLDFLMEKYGLNKRTLSQKSEIPYTTIDNWYKRGYEGLKLTTLRKLNDFFNTTLDYWILDEVTDQNYGKSSGFKVDYDEMEHVTKYRSLDPMGKETVSYILDKEVERTKTIAEQLRRITEMETEPEKSEGNGSTIIDIHPHLDAEKRLLGYYHSVSAGGGVFMMGDEGVENVRIPANIPGADIADYLVKISGNSMEPDYYDGDIALVARLEPVRLGDVGIFIVNGSAYIKEYGKTELISRNPDADNIKVSEHANIVCMGKVVGKIREEAMIKPRD